MCHGVFLWKYYEVNCLTCQRQQQAKVKIYMAQTNDCVEMFFVCFIFCGGRDGSRDGSPWRQMTVGQHQIYKNEIRATGSIFKKKSKKFQGRNRTIYGKKSKINQKENQKYPGRNPKYGDKWWKAASDLQKKDPFATLKDWKKQSFKNKLFKYIRTPSHTLCYFWLCQLLKIKISQCFTKLSEIGTTFTNM